MTAAIDWYHGSRPRTLPAAVAPVAIGSAIAYWEQSFNPLNALLALIVALALQVGVNYANDFSDGVRGTDEVRVGPVRLVGQGLAAAANVKKAAFLSFAVAGLAGLILTLLTQQSILIAVGALAIISAWFYTGGKNPYGYLGLGEIFVFVWFGIVAVTGTSFVQTNHVSLLSFIASLGAGALACAMLVVNNLRDIPTDTKAGKRTLAVRLGDERTRWLYVLLLWTAFGVSLIIGGYGYFRSETGWPAAAAVGALASLVAHRPGRAVINNAQGRDLIAVLSGTGKTQLAWAALTVFAIAMQRSL
ncbi:MAG: hypothetical protein RL410_484 [Actinomycetota bacterium]|jgi:1,4-dihydroxy-2-naphthoate octaprenyltransferase